MQATPAETLTAPATKPECLDIRGIASPDNVLTVLKRASELPRGGVLELRSDCNPWQLYDLLQQRGCFLLMEREADGTYHGKVTVGGPSPR